MAKRILITGAQGFVGQKLCAYLSEQGHTVLYTDTEVNEEDPNARACNVAMASSVDALIEWAGPLDAVIHLAAITFVPDAQANPTRVMDVNFLGTMHLIEAMKHYIPKARMLFVSTSEVYGPPRYLPIDEKHPFNPTNPYAISKVAADHYCAYVAKAGELDIVRMRPFNHSGPGQADRFVLSSFAHQLAAIEAGHQEPVLEVGNLEAARDFMHVDDVVRAYALALEYGESGEVYNLGSGESCTIQSALDALCSKVNVSVTIKRDPARMRPLAVPEICASHLYFTECCGWKPEKTFDELLDDLLTYWREVLHAVEETG